MSMANKKLNECYDAARPVRDEFSSKSSKHMPLALYNPSGCSVLLHSLNRCVCSLPLSTTHPNYAFSTTSYIFQPLDEISSTFIMIMKINMGWSDVENF